jgi:hypothetical protein
VFALSIQKLEKRQKRHRVPVSRTRVRTTFIVAGPPSPQSSGRSEKKALSENLTSGRFGADLSVCSPWECSERTVLSGLAGSLAHKGLPILFAVWGLGRRDWKAAPPVCIRYPRLPMSSPADSQYGSRSPIRITLGAEPDETAEAANVRRAPPHEFEFAHQDDFSHRQSSRSASGPPRDARLAIP